MGEEGEEEGWGGGGGGLGVGDFSVLQGEHFYRTARD